jgi:outer membrane protein TolC
MRFRNTEVLAVLLLAFLAPACTMSWWAEDADEDVADVIAEKRKGYDRFRESELIRPDLDPPGESEPEPEDLTEVPRVVGLTEALKVATDRSRDYRTQKESLYLAALALTNVRNEFSPFFTSTISSIVTDTDQTSRGDQTSFSIGVRQILPTGGDLSLSGGSSTGGGDVVVNERNYASDISVDLTQPLLRDAGYETSHERLTQAERNVVYAVRDFELFREDFTIQVATRFFNLVRQQREIVNTEANLKARDFLRRQSEEKFKVGLATEVDKLRAAREYLRAKSDLLSLKQSYSLTLDRFKVQLGLPTNFPLEIRPEEPNFRPIPVDLKTAVGAALHNRVDLHTSRDRLEDAQRGLRISANGMLPSLDFTGRYENAANNETSVTQIAFGNEGWSLGLTLEIPLERTAERNAMRRAMIDLDRARRDLTLDEDNVILEVRDSHRTLRRTEISLEIRQQEIHAAEREAAAAQIRFEAGEMDNQSVTDARNAVLRAQNAYITDLVEYEISRIQLLRDVGLLILDEHGMWTEPGKP